MNSPKCGSKNVGKPFIRILGKTLHKFEKVSNSVRAETCRPNTSSTEDLI